MTLYVEQAAINEGPHVQFNHIDGPLMTWAGHMHWLTWRERLSLLFGLNTITEIAERRWPHLAEQREGIWI